MTGADLADSRVRMLLRPTSVVLCPLLVAFWIFDAGRFLDGLVPDVQLGGTWVE